MDHAHDHRALGVEHLDRAIDDAKSHQRDIDGALLAENMDPGEGADGEADPERHDEEEQQQPFVPEASSCQMK